MADMPAILQQAMQMGLFSSAALVRFLSMDMRPNVTRFVTRTLPPAVSAAHEGPEWGGVRRQLWRPGVYSAARVRASRCSRLRARYPASSPPVPFLTSILRLAPLQVSREVVGRLMADPAFMQKFVLEQMITISSSLVYEAKVRALPACLPACLLLPAAAPQRLPCACLLLSSRACAGLLWLRWLTAPACCGPRLLPADGAAPYHPPILVPTVRHASLLSLSRRFAATASGRSWTLWPRTCSASLLVRGQGEWQGLAGRQAGAAGSAVQWWCRRLPCLVRPAVCSPLRPLCPLPPAANAALVYLVAPSRAAPVPGRFEWQNQLSKLPNNVFQATTPQREFSTGARAAAFFTKSAELCGVGMLAGAAQAALAQAQVALRRRADPAFQPSMPVPSVQQSALGFAAAHGIFANLRYQVGGWETAGDAVLRLWGVQGDGCPCGFAAAPCCARSALLSSRCALRQRPLPPPPPPPPPSTSPLPADGGWHRPLPV